MRRDANPSSENAKAILQGYDRAQQQIRDKNYAGAKTSLEAILPWLESAGDSLGQARVLTNLAQIDEITEQTNLAEVHYRRALDLASQAGDIQLQALAAHQLGHLLRVRIPREARELFVRSAAACTVLRDRRGRALSIAMIGQIDFTSGDRAGGMRQLQEALMDLPSDAAEHDHLVEHITYFCKQLETPVALRLIDECISETALRARLLAALVARVGDS